MGNKKKILFIALMLFLIIGCVQARKKVLIVWEPGDANLYSRSFVDDLEWEITKKGHDVRVAWSGKHFLAMPSGTLDEFQLIIWMVWEKVFAEKELEIRQYLDRGGSLVVMGGVPFCYSVVPQGDGWETVKSTWGEFFGITNDWGYMDSGGWQNELTTIGKEIFPSLGSSWNYGGLTRGYHAQPTTEMYPLVQLRASNGSTNSPFALVLWPESEAKVLLFGFGTSYSDSPFNPRTLKGKQFVSEFLEFMLEPVPQTLKAKMTSFKKQQLETEAYAVLPVPPEKHQYEKLIEPRPGDVWVAADGGFLASNYAFEAVDVWQRNLGQIGVAAVADPGKMADPKRWYDLELPFTVQNFGPFYVPYIDYMDAWEWDWRGTPMKNPGGGPLWGSAHAKSLPHEKTRYLFEQVVTSTIRKGAAGFGYQDMVWMWGGGRGKAGYHPQTIAAFKKDLAGFDEGIRIYTETGIETRYFADYYEYYFGIRPEPKTYGLESWEEYTPPLENEYKLLSSTLSQRNETLFDVLCSYEWLKFNQFLGDIAAKEGGVYQVIINPEDMANGTDSLWLNRLVNVDFNCDEFFHDQYQQLEAAYIHWPYFLTVPMGENQVGVCMETGPGGNGKPYYTMPLSYGQAYEITAALGATFFEADFWPGNQAPMAEVAGDAINKERMRQVLSYGLGFRHAYLDQLTRAEPQFTTITQRRIFRPWGAGWHPWSLRITLDGSFEETLRAMGYNISGWAEDGIHALPKETKHLFYSPDLASLHGFKQLATWLEEKEGRTAITSASTLALFVDQTGVLKENEGEVFGLQLELVANAVNGPLKEEKEQMTKLGNYGLSNYYTLSSDTNLKHLYYLGETPIVSQLTIGKSRLIIFNFDPEQTELIEKITGEILAEDGITPPFEYRGDLVARLYESAKGFYAVGVTYTPTTHYGKGEDEVFPYKDRQVDGLVRIKLEPNKTYHVLYYLEGRTETYKADDQGWVSLPFSGAHYGLLFIVENDKKELLSEKESDAKALMNYWESDQIEFPEEVRLGN